MREWTAGSKRQQAKESRMELSAGKTAYEAYAGARHWRTLQGDDMLPWLKLPPSLRHAWLVAAMAVLDSYGKTAPTTEEVATDE